MSIGSNIKRLRREKDITQEQLAEYLGITSRAVSQWECDRTAPDLSQIPALCHIFEVSSDTLLGIDIKKSNEAIRNYIDKANSYDGQGEFENSVEILREANHKFPKSYAIMQLLAEDIVLVNRRKCNKDYDEVFDLCNRILAECTDSTIRKEAIQTLASAYGYAGKREEMLKLTEEMPNVYFTREDFMRYRWKGDADFGKMQGYLDYLAGRLIEMLGIAAKQRHDNNEFVYSLEDRIRLWKTSTALLELLFPDGDYLFYAGLGDKACIQLCSAYLEMGDCENAWYWLEKRADFVIHMETYAFNAPFTSPVLRGVVPGGWLGVRGNEFSRKILDWLTTAAETAVLRNDKRYENLVKRLKTVPKRK